MTRQINMTGIDKNGNSHTFCREFTGIKNIVKSYFMSVQNLLAWGGRDLPSPIYIVNSYSYFAVLKDNK